MKIGAMNHPGRDPLCEMEWMGALKFDFIDLTLEPPGAASWRVDPVALRAAAERLGLEVVGHTPFYLPLASPIKTLRAVALAEMRRCIAVLAAAGAQWVNVHPDRNAPHQSALEMQERNCEALAVLLDVAADHGVGLMVENHPGRFNTPEGLAPLLEPLPGLGLHLDIGHANLGVEENTTAALAARFGSRIRHVHLHDNRGGEPDLHLPLGAGTLDWRAALCAVKATGYDGTITLEVFTEDRHYLAHSRDRLREAWATA